MTTELISKIHVVAGTLLNAGRPDMALRVLRFAGKLVRLGRGDPAQLLVTSPETIVKAPKDPATTVKDHGDTLLTVLKLMTDDKDLDDVINKLNKSAATTQKTFDKLSKSLIKGLAGKNDGEELLKQSRLKEVADSLEQMGKELKPYVDTATYLKSLQDQVRREKKSEPITHKKKTQKVEVKPKTDVGKSVLDSLKNIGK